MKLHDGALLVIWDESQGQYVQMPENVCLARWATGTLDRFGQIDHSGGDICGREATDEVGDTPMCPHHHERAMKWLDKERDRDAYERRVELEEELARERDRRAWPQAALEAKEKELRKWQRRLEREEYRIDQRLEQFCVIYYVRRADGLIKIGTTRELVNRMSSLQKEHGDLEVLLTHRGSYAREKELHGQFAGLRVTGEWFRPERELLNWILVQRKAPADLAAAPGTVPVGYIRDLALAAAPAA